MTRLVTSQSQRRETAEPEPGVVLGVVCVNYADYLAVTLPANAARVRCALVLTSEGDAETRRVVTEVAAGGPRGPVDVRLHTVPDELVHRRGATFNKSALVRQLQLHMNAAARPDDWLLLLDADIMLPDGFDALFRERHAALDRDGMYSLPRHDFYSREHLATRKVDKVYQVQFAGFCQMYHRRDVLYGEHSADCSQCDIFFKNAFRSAALLSAEHPVLHLGIEGWNWKGRVTPQWT